MENNREGNVMNMFYGILVSLAILLIPAGMMYSMNKEKPSKKKPSKKKPSKKKPMKKKTTKRKPSKGKK